MPDGRRAFGEKGESLAAAFLHRRGLRVVATNFATPVGEIDLVCLDGACVVFVEVKTRRSGRFGHPEEAITPAKRQRMARAAHRFLTQRAWESRPYRFDAVAVTRLGDLAPEIVHYEGIDMPDALW